MIGNNTLNHDNILISHRIDDNHLALHVFCISGVLTSLTVNHFSRSRPCEGNCDVTPSQ
jgi:hypothetical protein